MADSNDWLKGNDNYIGRIGEMVAMRHLQQHHGLQLKDIKERNKSASQSTSKRATPGGASNASPTKAKPGERPLTHLPAKGAARRMECSRRSSLFGLSTCIPKSIKISGIAYPQGLQAATEARWARLLKKREAHAGDEEEVQVSAQPARVRSVF